MHITDGFDLLDNHAYATKGVPHDVWTRLRAESPVHRCAPDGYEPFWAITKHADICEISQQPEKFSSEPGIVMLPNDQASVIEPQRQNGFRVLINMDPPEHREYRKVAAPVFTPRAVKALDDAINTSARELLDDLAGETGEGECDFANDVAAAHPLRILSTMLGVPRESEPDILRLTNELFGFDDPDLQRKDAEDVQQALRALGLELYQMFDGIIQDRRACPRDDLASVLANGTINGEPMAMVELMGYYLITFSAGHDTTKNALVGGMHALLDNPDQFDKLRRHPELVELAVEENVRWTSPVNYMRRTATKDYELRGEKIRAGDNVVMFYASANRDEEIFDNPFTLRIDREPNRHLGFGYGEHFCLGANLARRSQRALLLELAHRLEWAELAGEPEQIHSSFVVGLKQLPIRYRIKPGTQRTFAGNPHGHHEQTQRERDGHGN